VQISQVLTSQVKFYI